MIHQYCVSGNEAGIRGSQRRTSNPLQRDASKHTMADVKVQNSSGGQQPEHSVALAPHSVDETGDDIVQQQSRFKALTDVFSKLRDNAAHNFKNVCEISFQGEY